MKLKQIPFDQYCMTENENSWQSTKYNHIGMNKKHVQGMQHRLQSPGHDTKIGTSDWSEMSQYQPAQKNSCSEL